MAAIVPPQAVPLFDDPNNASLVGKTWWLAFTALESLINAVKAMIPSGGAAALTVEEFTLSANTVVTPVTVPVLDAVLLVIVSEDATGGWTITWASNVKWAVTNIDPTALTVSVFEFVGRVNPATSALMWYAIGIPLTGQVP